jgi:hypothetical protein
MYTCMVIGKQNCISLQLLYANKIFKNQELLGQIVLLAYFIFPEK